MNAAGFPILSLVTWLPLVGCAVILAVRGEEAVVVVKLWEFWESCSL